MPIKNEISTRELRLDQINVRDGTESRPLNSEFVDEYKGIFALNRKTLPAVDVFSDGTVFWLADGFHRYAAAKSAGLKTLPASVHPGDRLEALKFALGSNTEHGYRRTAADKRFAVIKAFQEFEGQSDRSYADMCQVSPTFVGNIRRELFPATVHNDSSEGTADPKRVGKDGKKRRMPRRDQAPDQKAAVEVNGETAAESTVQPGAVPPASPCSAQNGDDVQGNQADFDSKFEAFDCQCEEVAEAAASLLAKYRGRQRSQVRSRLNDLRSTLEHLTKANLSSSRALPRGDAEPAYDEATTHQNSDHPNDGPPEV